MLKEIHEQADAVAETIADRTARDDGVDLGDVGRDRRRDPARRQARSSSSPAAPPTTPGLIGRYAIEEWARVPVEMDIASEYRYRNPVVGPGDLVDRHLAVGRDRRHAGGDADRPRARRDVLGDHERDGLAGHARRRRRPVHARRPGDRRRRDEDVRLPGGRDVSARPAARGAARDAAARSASPRSSPSSSTCRTASPSCWSTVEPQVERDRRRATTTRTSSCTSAATSGCRSRSRARSSSRRSPTSRPTPTPPAR